MVGDGRYEPVRSARLQEDERGVRIGGCQARPGGHRGEDLTAE
jgi:hypothetical protein